MAHFAELDENNNVLRVIVVNNEMLLDKKGKEKESLGIDFCKSLYGTNTNWIQTSYNGNFRGQYAGFGMIYDPVQNIFYTPQSTVEEE